MLTHGFDTPRRRALVSLLSLGVGVGGCTEPSTQLVVAVDSDLEVPALLTEVEVRATVTGRAEVVSTFDVTGGPGSACTPSACPLPLTVGVVPESGDASESAVVVVRGLGPSGVLVTRKIRTGFVKAERLALPVFLASSCRGVSCEAGATCDRGMCVAQAVDPSTLDPVPDRFEPSRLFPTGDRPDAGPQSAGRDAASQGPDSATQVADAAVLTSDAGAAVMPTPPEWVATVTSTVPLYFTRSEVTVGQFEACVQAEACTRSGYFTGPHTSSTKCNLLRYRAAGSDPGDRFYADQPMNCVNWHGAGEFCRWAGGRLPFEEEWYAEASNNGARAYAWGDTPAASCTHVVMWEGRDGCDRNSTWPVCSKRAGDSISGLCDMIGNVAEWTQDEWSEGNRAVRGGHFWYRDPAELRASERLGNGEYRTENAGVGFRCVRDAPP